jgi:hypothetical protein
MRYDDFIVYITLDEIIVLYTLGCFKNKGVFHLYGLCMTSPMSCWWCMDKINTKYQKTISHWDLCRQKTTSNNQAWGFTGIIRATTHTRKYYVNYKHSWWSPTNFTPEYPRTKMEIQWGDRFTIPQLPPYFIFYWTSRESKWHWTNPNLQLHFRCLFLQKLF